jgi:hypothetical protein
MIVHTLIFDSHIAALEPGTGMGLLVLPDPERNIDLVLLRPRGQAAETMSRQWFGSSVDNHVTILRQLASIGWELPRDDQGGHVWFDAGCTGCCGRTMISLIGTDVYEADSPAQDFIEAARVLQESAESACQLMTQCRRPSDLHRQDSLKP